MISTLDLRGRRGLTPLEVSALLPRADVNVEDAAELVRPVLDDVRKRGTAAVKDATLRFDGIELEALRVPPEEIAAAGDQLDELQPGLRAAIEECIRRCRVVHEAQRLAEHTTQVAPGATVTERYVPVGRVGLYVPGGLVAYPSSVVMNVVPAQVAGVRSIAVMSPPQKAYNGRPHPAILGACALLGIDEVYAVGGAQAIAMAAYGTEDCPPVDVITGPGNVYVAAAKRLVRGFVGIDAEAGPTEIAILADDTADPTHLAADLIAQAEHDPMAACLLVTPSQALLDAVAEALVPQVAATRHRERVEISLAGQSALVLVDDLDHGIEVVDVWAAEHLEVITDNARDVAMRIRNAGAIFVGPYAPVSLGDYLAGSNHVLPTAGSARHTAGLSVHSFLRGIHVIDYDRDALAAVAPFVMALGGAEDLIAHTDAVAIRVGRD
ncbi:histidinol dehydrogenase [Acidothermaceae bacterium B102]|nr:histidinol dehydrogenase [Acidothermaceae bacterium B102]